MTAIINGNWRKYTDKVPEDCKVLGVASTGGVTGALVKFNSRLKKNNFWLYAVVNKRKLYPVDARRFGAHIGVGQPRKPGKYYSVRLTDELVKKAKTIGDGNVSEGAAIAINSYKVNL